MKKFIKIFGSWKFTIVLIFLLIGQGFLYYYWVAILMLFEESGDSSEYYISNNKITITSKMNLYSKDRLPYSEELEAIYIRFKGNIIAVGELNDIDERKMNSYFDYIISYLNDQDDLENQFIYHFVINKNEGWGFRCYNEEYTTYVEENLVFPDRNLYFSFLGFNLEFEDVIDYLGILYFTDVDSLEWSRTPF